MTMESHSATVSRHRSSPWHTQKTAAIAQHLHANIQMGLKQTEIDSRLRQYGSNSLAEGESRSIATIIAGQFRDFMILVLIAAAIISGLVSEPQDAIAIVVIVVLNALIGTIQEYRAERAMAALRTLAAPDARVLRDGLVQTIPARDLVPGDVVILEAGMVVPADMRLFDLSDLQIDEAAMTGESVPVLKSDEVYKEVELNLGDRRNMAFKGTLVSKGRGRGLVVATGMYSELGRIAGLVSGAENLKTPLQQRLQRFGRRLALSILAICLVIFITGLLRGEALVLMFLTAVSLAVAAIPEALPAVVTIALAFGARKMSQLKALIRHLPAVETLGSVTYICSDKTGTLTENRMHLEHYLVNGVIQTQMPEEGHASSNHRMLGLALALNNDVHISPDNAFLGDPTEVALFEGALAAGYEKKRLEIDYQRLAELPFDSERKRMTTLNQMDDGVTAFVKGAPEQVLPHCMEQYGDASGVWDSAKSLAQAEQLANEGYRVLALACRRFESLPGELTVESVESDLAFLGMVALIDPPRPEAEDAVAECKRAGITPVMITGDHPGTALAIARRLGITEEGQRVMTGVELATLNDDDFARQVADIRVYARVNPEQKIRIVKALQTRGEFVAMTGDGVNDAPSLKQADIGVAMGMKGTDVAREAADMVLLDDNFATIVSAVRAGRRIYDNIRKFIKDTMSSNSGEIWTLFLAPFLGLPIPLLPIHILWINLVTDGLPGLAFTAEPAEKGIMRRPPRPPHESIFAHGMWQHIVWVGLFVAGITLAAQAWAISRGIEHWQTIVFTVLTVSQLFHSMAVRSERESLFSQGLASNLPMLGAVLLTLLLQLAVIYLPVLNPIFHTQPIPFYDLGVCLALSSLVLVAVEIEKWLMRRGLLYQS